MNIEKLKNGIQFIVIKKDVKAPFILNVYFNVGSRNESAENNGIAHMTEHFFARKLKQRSKNKFEAFTNKGMTCFSFQPPENEIKFWVNNFKDILNNFKIDKIELQKEKEIILSEIARDKDDFFSQSDRDFAKKYYRNNSLALDALGTAQNIEKFSEKDIRLFLQKFYQPSNMVVVLGVSSTYDTEEVKSILEDIDVPKKNSYPNFQKKFTGLKKNVFNVFPKKTEQLYISIFKPFPIKNYKETAQWEFFIDILQHVLRDILIEENGYTYSIDVSISKYSDFFNLFIDCEIRKEKLLNFYTKLSDILVNFPEKLTKEDLNELKKEKIESINEQKGDLEELADLIGGQAVLYGNKNIIDFMNIENIISNLDFKDIEGMAHQLSKAAHFIHLTGEIDSTTKDKLKNVI